MGQRGPKPLNAKDLELHGSPRAEARRKEEKPKKTLLADVLNRTFLQAFLVKDPPYSQADIDDALDYFVQLSAEEFIRCIVILLREEFGKRFETPVSLTKIIELLQKDRAEIGRNNEKDI